MPGEVKRLTPDELAQLETFPFPPLATSTLKSRNLTDILICTDLKATDMTRLKDFYQRMRGLSRIPLPTAKGRSFSTLPI